MIAAAASTRAEPAHFVPRTWCLDRGLFARAVPYITTLDARAMILHRPGAAVDLSCFVDGGRVRVVVNAGIPARAATDGPARGRGVAATPALSILSKRTVRLAAARDPPSRS